MATNSSFQRATHPNARASRAHGADLTENRLISSSDLGDPCGIRTRDLHLERVILHPSCGSTTVPTEFVSASNDPR